MISQMMLFFYRFKRGDFGKFYGMVDPMVVTCDSYPRWTKRGHIELYHAKPSVAIQNRADFRSNLGYDTIVRGRTGLRRLAWGAWRLYGHMMDELYFRLTGR